jgi:hypothetical protein
MFEPAKNSKAPDFSEALILLGRDGEIRTHDPLHPMNTFDIFHYLFFNTNLLIINNLK